MQAEAQPTVERLARLAEQTPGLHLLVLFGSRARGDVHGGSDWDFGYLGSRELDVGMLHASLTGALQTERVDLVDLARAGALLRYRAAKDGVPIHESQPQAFESFWLDAVHFWCEVQPILERGYEDVLRCWDRRHAEPSHPSGASSRAPSSFGPRRGEAPRRA